MYNTEDSGDHESGGDWRRARKKPVEIEFRGPYTEGDVIETLEGDFEIDQDYLDEHGGFVIIRGVDGEVYPCALDIFRETYEVVLDGATIVCMACGHRRQTTEENPTLASCEKCGSYDLRYEVSDDD